jgi:hypothetical protein
VRGGVPAANSLKPIARRRDVLAQRQPEEANKKAEVD